MKFSLLLVFSLGILTCFSQKQKTDKRFVNLDTAFSRVLKEWKTAGFAVAVVEKDKVIYAKGFGYEDYEKKKPVTVNSQFAIGSCTKAFTASLLGILRKEGLVDLDKPVTGYLPKLKFYNDELNNHVTLKDMMTHRTGLPRHDYSWYIWQSASIDSLIGRIQYLKPSAGLRERWQYNNWMYFLQGAVTARLTGKSWEENIREKFFIPLGMLNSNLTLKERLDYKEAAKGYGVKDDSVISALDFYNIDGMGPAGSINSTVLDMAKWVNMWIHGGKYNGKEIVPAAYINEAKSSQMVISGAMPGNDNPELFFSNYGYGWAMSSYRGHYRVEHGGNIDGFSASTSFFPSDSIGIIVLSNQTNSSVPGVVRNILADRMLGLPGKDWQTTLRASADKAQKEAKEGAKSAISNQKKGTQPSHPFKDFTGLYNNPGYGDIEVYLKRDSLFSAMGTFNGWFRHYHYDVFENFILDKKTGLDTSDTPMKIMFKMNEAGDIEGLSAKLEPLVEAMEFVKRPRVEEISKDSLTAYLGFYELSGMKLQVALKADSLLTLIVPGQPEYELQPIAKDQFALKGMAGFTVQFIRGPDNKVIELLSQQPNGTFKAKKEE